jgi:hypothetical protein
MHYLDGAGNCRWCGQTKAQIAAADRARADVEAIASVEAAADAARAAARRDRYAQPHNDSCPTCGRVTWTEADPQQCGYCGTRVCPLCGADFAEAYAPAGHGRLSDNLGAHLAQWHADTDEGRAAARRAEVRRVLADLYEPAIPVTDAMVDEVIAGLDTAAARRAAAE